VLACIGLRIDWERLVSDPVKLNLGRMIMLDPHQEGFEKLVTMIEAIDVGMLTIAEENGELRSRPMTTQRAEKGVLWFFAGKNLVNAEKDARVNVSYADPNNEVYVSVSGVAQTFRDPAKARELWSGDAQRWFTEGPDDPRLIILKVEIKQAEYWDIDKRAMIQLLDKGASAAEILSATDHKRFS
jgi:general stress protein 26